MDAVNERRQPKKTTDKDTWGYAVCFGTVITFIAGLGHINSFGLIYNDFIKDTKSSAKSLTTAHGVFAIMLAIGGLLLNILSKRYPLKYGGLIGVLLHTTGTTLTIFIQNTNQLSITFGVLQGIGFGMMVPVCYSTINFYFVTKRTTVMSTIKALQGLIIMCYPQLLRIIISYYGFRGTLLILAGVSLHVIPGILAMETRTNTCIIKKIAKDKDVDKCNAAEARHLLVINEDSGGTKARKNISKFISEILEILNVRVLKDLVYCNICFGQSFVNFSDLTFFIFQPMLLFQYGFDERDVATCISIGAGADVFGRFSLALISSLYTINTRLLFYVATIFTLIARIVLLLVTRFTWVAVVTGVLGLLRAVLHVSSPLVISNHVTNQQFPGAYALFMLTGGAINVAVAPFIGMLKDHYKSYIPSFVALSVCCLPCLVLWPLEYVFCKNTNDIELN